MVGDVVGIGEDEHIVVGRIRAAGVDSDDDLPVTCPVHPVHHDGDAPINIVDDRLLKALDGVELQVSGGVILHIPADKVKHVGDVLHGGAAAFTALNELPYQPLMVSLLPEPVEYHQGAGGATGIFGGLLIGFEVGQDMERVVADHVVVIVEHIVAGVVVIRFSRKGGRAVLAEVGRVFFRIGDGVLFWQRVGFRHGRRLLFAPC